MTDADICPNNDPRKRVGPNGPGFWEVDDQGNDQWRCNQANISCNSKVKPGYVWSGIYQEDASRGHNICCGDDCYIGSWHTRVQGWCTPDPATYPSKSMDLVRCCEGVTPVNACRPGYCPSQTGGTGCRDIYRNWCSDQFRLGTDGSPEDRAAGLKICKEWCMANPGECDRAMYKYAAEHPEDKDINSCINYRSGTSDTDTSRAIAVCASATCKSRGYKTRDMMNINCPNVCSIITQCEQRGKQTNCGISNIDYRCACGGQCSSGPEPTPGPQSTIVLVIIILLIGVALIIMGIAVSIGKKADKLNSAPQQSMVKA